MYGGLRKRLGRSRARRPGAWREGMGLSAPGSLCLGLLPGTLVAPPDASFSISGRITDREGRGVGGARVMAYPQIGSVRDSLIERLILMPPITENAQKPPAQTASGNDGSYRIEGLERRSVAVTDRRGSFEFRGLMPGPLSL